MDEAEIEAVSQEAGRGGACLDSSGIPERPRRAVAGPGWSALRGGLPQTTAQRGRLLSHSPIPLESTEYPLIKYSIKI